MMSDVPGIPEEENQCACGCRKNYIRTCRKRCGLTQKEMGFLLCCEDGNPVYRYERGRQIPSLRSTLACEIILGVAAHELFAGIYEEVEQIIHNRAHLLSEHLMQLPQSIKVQRKLEVIDAIMSQKRGASKQDV